MLRAATLGSLSAAARDLGLTPAAASRRLALLEQRLGARLFARTTRRLRPTAEGEAFLPHAERVLAAVADAGAALPGGAGASAALAGTLRLTAPATFGRKVLAPILAELLAAAPALRLDLLLTDSVVDLVESGRDAAVRIAPTLGGQSLVVRRVGENRRVLCAAPAYLRRRGTPADLAELARHDALLLGAVDGWALALPDGSTKRVRPSARMASNSNEALREACLAGLGIGLHSTWDVGEHLARGDLVALPESLGVPEPLGIWLVLPGTPAAAVPARVRAFAELLGRRLPALAPA